MQLMDRLIDMMHPELARQPQTPLAARMAAQTAAATQTPGPKQAARQPPAIKVPADKLDEAEAQFNLSALKPAQSEPQP